MTKIQKLAVLVCIAVLTTADAPKGASDRFGPWLRADHVLRDAQDATRLIKANPSRYIAIPILTLEVQGWLIEPFDCPVEVLQKAIRIEWAGSDFREARRAYQEIAAHNEGLARSSSTSSCRRLDR